VNSAIVSGTAVASTSGTSIDFTGIPSWAKRITVMFDGVSTSGASVVQVQIGDSGGAETSGYLGATTFFSASGIVTTNGTTGFTLNNGGDAAANLRHGSLIITNVTGNTWSCIGNIGLSGLTRASIVGYSKALSDTLDRIRITTVNGTDTFDAGSINILYE
jgi:hypothetical protein